MNDQILILCLLITVVPSGLRSHTQLGSFGSALTVKTSWTMHWVPNAFYSYNNLHNFKRGKPHNDTKGLLSYVIELAICI